MKDSVINVTGSCWDVVMYQEEKVTDFSQGSWEFVITPRLTEYASWSIIDTLYMKGHKLPALVRRSLGYYM